MIQRKYIGSIEVHYKFDMYGLYRECVMLRLTYMAWYGKINRGIFVGQDDSMKFSMSEFGTSKRVKNGKENIFDFLNQKSWEFAY